MTEDRSPPPEAEACLCRRYSSSQKGGTLIAEDVTDLEEHVRRLHGARYRPGCCPTCGGRMHVHGDRPRLLLGHPAVATVVARFRCATEQCRAVWQVVPAFLARHLWRAWETVEDVAIHGTPTVDVPERTQRRWRARAATSAAMVVTALTMVVSTELITIAKRAGPDATRRDVVVLYGRLIGTLALRPLESLSALVHRLAPGVRVM